MARFKDRQKALILRKQGMSYSQIRKILGVSKSTLSYWLRDYPLSKERIRELRDCNQKRIEKFRETMQRKKERRLKEIYDVQKKLILPLSTRDYFIAGLFLYWGEGSKSKSCTLSLSNTDPSILKFFIVWLINILKVPKEKIRVQLYLYSDMDIKKEIQFWSNILDIPKNQFNKPYIKESTSQNINHESKFKHGTCSVRVGNARLQEKVLMAIKVISDQYSFTKGM